jgi:hypothetical protein
MFNLFKNFYKNNFVYSAKEKLSKLTILFILILNIIVFNIILEGQKFQVNFVSSPYNKYPNYCTNFINSLTRINFDTFSSIEYYTNDISYYGEIFSDNLDFRCVQINNKINNVKNEHNLEEINLDIEELNKKIFSTRDEIKYFKNNYNTTLFEKLANQDTNKSILQKNLNSENIKIKYQETLKKEEELNNKKEEIYKKFQNSKSIIELNDYILSIKSSYLDDREKAFDTYYNLIEIKILFLLPMVILFFYLMKRYLKSEKYILYIIFKNLFMVSLIPTLYTIFLMIYKFLPKVYITEIIQFFYDLEIPFVVYYLLVIVFVVIFTYFIIKIQKHFKEKNEKLKRNKITIIESFNQNSCNSCGNKVSYISMNYCPICQNRLKIKCNSCENETVLGLNFCQNCGEKLEN